jgi:hypothetical protein
VGRWVTAAALAAASVFGGAVLGALAAAGPAAAADDDLSVSVRADNPVAPVLTLTNRSPAPCQVATTSLGTVAYRAVQQGSTVAVPTVFQPGFDESLDTVVTQGLRTLAPGASLDIPLPIVHIGPTGYALESVSWTGTTGPRGAFYPIVQDQPLHLDLTYSWQVPPPHGPPLCGTRTEVAASASPAAAAQPAGRATGSWLLWVGLAVAVLALTVVLVLRVRRRARGASAAVVVMLAALLAPALHTRPAFADFSVPPSLQSQFDTCMGVLHQPGHDPAAILPTLEAPGVTVTLEVPSDGVNHEGAVSRSLMIIFWNPNDHHQYAGTGGNADPCTTLYHEMYHAWEDTQGIQDHHECITADGTHTGIGINEVHATRAQNPLRAALGLHERDYYGDNKLPPGECRPSQPSDPICSEQGCGTAHGDPHLTTFDGRHYDFQAVGEFVAARDPAGGFTIQVRQQPYRDSRLIAVNTAVAMDVAGDRVEVRPDGAKVAVLVAGRPSTVDLVGLDHGGQVRHALSDDGDLATVIWPDGSTAWVSSVGGAWLNLSVQPAPSHTGHLEGLLGDFDGSPGNDIRPHGGAPVAGSGQPAFAALYPAVADSWRIDAKSSLFTYPAGRDTTSYTDRSFPEKPATVDSLANRAAAEAACRGYGVTDPVLLEDCVLDVGLTGQLGFAEGARAAQAFATGVGSGQPFTLPATADIYLAGAAPVPSLPQGAGTLPLRVAFDRTVTRVSFPQVSGIIGPWAANTEGPDGGTEFSGTDIDPFNGISGVVHHTRSLFLVGVFLPARPIPSQQSAKPDLTDADKLAEIRPDLGQVFYIGSGKTPDGTVRQIVIPAGAASLYVGFADASGFRGSPGAYDDNTGGLTIRTATG